MKKEGNDEKRQNNALEDFVDLHRECSFILFTPILATGSGIKKVSKIMSKSGTDIKQIMCTISLCDIETQCGYEEFIYPYLNLLYLCSDNYLSRR